MRVTELSRSRINGRADRRGRQEYAVPVDSPLSVMRLAGSARRGTEGWVYHAIENGRALCGKRPGPTSAGWIDDALVKAVSCRFCAEALRRRS